MVFFAVDDNIAWAVIKPRPPPGTFETKTELCYNWIPRQGFCQWSRVGGTIGKYLEGRQTRASCRIAKWGHTSVQILHEYHAATKLGRKMRPSEVGTDN
jgi:hypothetical protein